MSSELWNLLVGAIGGGVIAGVCIIYLARTRMRAAGRGTQERLERLQFDFNAMITEVHDLFYHRMEEARLQRDLHTAREVQETIMPEPEANYGPWSVTGRSFTAKECGGDWWYHADVNGKLVFWIGDVTGHSVASALIASAARAAAAGAVLAGIDRPDLAMNFVNRVLTPLLREKMFVTCLAVTVDMKTGEAFYCQASHEPAVLFSGAPNAANSSFRFLLDGNNPPLGMDTGKPFVASRFQMSQHDTLFLYTDGLHDLLPGSSNRTSQRASFERLRELRQGLAAGADLVRALNRGFSDTDQIQNIADDVTFAVIQAPAHSLGSSVLPRSA